MTFTIYDEFLTKVLNTCHAKTGFRVFVGVMPQEGLVDINLRAAKASFGMTLTTIVLCCPHTLYFQYGKCDKKGGLAALVPAK